jgi:hypothetical protein
MLERSAREEGWRNECLEALVDAQLPNVGSIEGEADAMP